MINYSIPKPHPLCGHFIQINSQAEYDRMNQIAEECGFRIKETNNNFTSVDYAFYNSMTLDWRSRDLGFGQQITLDELEKLVELSKIKLPQVMEVSDRGNIWHKRTIVDFYMGKPVFIINNEEYITYNHFRLLDPHQAEIEKLEAEIKSSQAKLYTLKNASK